MRLPIAFKMIGVIIAILVSAAAGIAYFSLKGFEEKTSDRELDLNLKSAQAKSNEAEQILFSLTDKMKSLGFMVYKNTNDHSDETLKMLNQALKQQKEFYSFEIYEIKDKIPQLLQRLVNEDKLKESGPKYNKSYIENLRTSLVLPIVSLTTEKFYIQNSTLPNEIPILTIGLPLVKNDFGQVTHVVFADLTLSALQKIYSSNSERIYYLIDGNGNVIAHSNESLALTKTNMLQDTFVKKFRGKNKSMYQLKYRDKLLKEFFYGAGVKNGFGLTNFTLTSDKIIQEPIQSVRRKVFLVSGYVISISIFVIFVFSSNLTSPIEKLAGLIHQVSRGNFNVSARKVVKSKDEVGDLANAFDKMTDGLKERDKVKNLFNKFHGSSIAEEMMHGEVGVKGTSKEVVVFFSDIRGFTKFSEGHTPEQVVSMLNEYFAVMVSIITKNHGVVDKFIGDAIMAIWGAPKSTGNDQYNAVKACLEMRVALAELNTKRISRGEGPIMIGMGVHSGPAISGTIGSEDRMEYTVIGDTVNMSSRIESSTKAFGTDLLLSETLAGAIDGKFALDIAGSAEVKGKAEPLKLFKVAGYKSANGDIVNIKTPYSEYHAEHADKVKVS